MEECIFCQIVAKQVPAKVVYEDENCLAFLDINPLAAGHTLVIPKKHTKNILEIDEATLKHLICVVKKLSENIKGKLQADGINIFQSNEKAAGQEIHHFHIHIIPRKLEDGLELQKYWAMKIKKMSDEQLEKIAKLIKMEDSVEKVEEAPKKVEEEKPRSKEEVYWMKREMNIA